MNGNRFFLPALAGLMVMVSLLAAPLARAHCDTMDGPVIIEAQAALANGDITPVLKWVKPEHEAEVRAAFDLAKSVRTKGDDAKKMADQFFFETLVRVHRAGENAPYDGIKPAGMQEEVIVAADRALDKASSKELEDALVNALRQGLKERYERTAELKQHAAHNVDAGREFVAAYVEYMHYVERLHNDAVTSAVHGEEHSGHETDEAAAPACGHK